MAAPRPERDEYMMSIALAVAARTNCMKTPVGAIIVQDYRVRAVGYNGTVEGYPNCFDGGCPRCKDLVIERGEKLDQCVCAHAEQNALLSAARFGIGVEGAECWVTNEPCLDCTKSLIQAKLKVVRYWHTYKYSGPGDQQQNRSAMRKHSASQRSGTRFVRWKPGPKAMLGLGVQYVALESRIDAYAHDKYKQAVRTAASKAKTARGKRASRKKART